LPITGSNNFLLHSPIRFLITKKDDKSSYKAQADTKWTTYFAVLILRRMVAK